MDMYHDRAGWWCSALLLLTVLLSVLPPSLQCGGGGGGGGGPSAAERQRHDQWCYSNCVGSWGSWYSCSRSCGGGTQWRHRPRANTDSCSHISCYQSMSQNRSCNTKCPNGIRVNSYCQCHPGFTGSCCGNRLRCPTPSRPANGDVQANPTSYVNYVAHYTCRQGYRLEGDGEPAVCLQHGNAASWSHGRPRCIHIRCQSPGHLDVNLAIQNPKQGGYVYGDTIHFSCEYGHELLGGEMRQCRQFNDTHGQWTGSNPRCERVTCEDPGSILHGHREGRSTKFRDLVTYTCDEGYRLIGSATRECTANRGWTGVTPSCEEILCEAPMVPEHGRVRIRRTPSSQMALFSCDEGYFLEGNSSTLTCTAEGYWDNSEPTCTATDCGHPGEVEHGHMDGAVFVYPWDVTFYCHPGYILEGEPTLRCQDNGLWDGTAPECNACPFDTYANEYGNCSLCPAHSHTPTNASTLIQQCICDDGYTAVEDACLQVRCPDLAPPEFSNITECATQVGQWCNFTCHDGYVAEQGATSRECQENGIWGGTDVTCSPCEVGTYKSSERVCTACPPQSSTNTPGQMAEGCVCNAGFGGPAGGPCVDVDECATNSGRGPCEDGCENTVGSYRCHCGRPGYEVDRDDPHACFPERQCKNLTDDEAPRHGGLVCHWYDLHSTVSCSVRCNHGYEHPSGVNPYHTCGPTTDYIWSFKLVSKKANVTLPPCIDGFYPGITLEASTYYFTTDCSSMTASERRQVMEEFAKVLNKNKICAVASGDGWSELCEIKHMGINCGNTVRRRRRDTGSYEEVSEVELVLNITALGRINKTDECGLNMCQILNVSAERCEELCVSTYMRFLKDAVKNAERQLQDIFNDSNLLQTLAIQAANRVFEPQEHQTIRTSDVIEECDAGMALVEGTCRACQKGFYLDSVNRTCAECPLNTYQDETQQEACKPCPPGMYTTMEGSKACSWCDDGFWGEGCSRTCRCTHGICNPQDGSCTCLSGYEGADCSIDIPGCRDMHCSPGVTCTDVPAPGIGITCGACAEGYVGDGFTCTPLSPCTPMLKMPPGTF